jgi:Cu(I)/Ag(I) efflux system membrane fusion protein/cobalt-zinc-cadmium efflux system membrane fusion protein
MMRPNIVERVVSVLSVLALSFLIVTIQMVVCTPRASAQNTSPATQAKPNVDLTTDPSPAQKGTNTVRVKLTDPTGKPISGADVTVTFFMAAMPSMNMPAMKTVVKGADKGAGIYEGKGDLGSGGMWQVTITAKQNGQTMATKKLAIKATGGA